MLNTSSVFNDEMKSNVRSRLEPSIIVHGTDEYGTEVSHEWKPQHIKSLKFKRSIDPTGNFLPTMELTWTEIYEGKLNAEAQPLKYENVLAQMAVDLIWILQTDGQEAEVVRFPRLFLTTQPKIKGNVINWTATDCLSFFNQKWTKFFDGETNPTSIKNIVMYGLTEARAIFWNNVDLRGLIQKSILNIDEMEWDSAIGLPVLCDGILKEQIARICAIDNAFLDFDQDGAIKISQLTARNKVFDFSANIMFDFPQITMLNDIGKYSWTQSVFEEKTENSYGKFASTTIDVSGVNMDRFDFDGYGKAENDLLSEINHTFTIEKPEGSKIVTVIPIEKTERRFEISEVFVENGEVVEEYNQLCPFDDAYAQPVWRYNYLKSLMNCKTSILNFKTLGNIAIETGDRVGVETNLYDEENNRIFKEGFAFDIKIEYNGAVKESLKVNEFSGWLNG